MGLSSAYDNAITKSSVLTNLICVPTPSTIQLPVAYFSGVTCPTKFNFMPLSNSTPLDVVYFFWPIISDSTSIAVASSTSAILIIPPELILLLFW